MEEIRNSLSNVREQLRDHSLSLLSDAVYRGDTQAKQLERQCAKVSRAIDKAIHEFDVLENMKSSADLE